ncbi:hypothetical protein TSMEX_002322 [Taenia solium]|eukprot:TsM_000366300 transcript=TsM_000366300 gene=TsM_000366300
MDRPEVSFSSPMFHPKIDSSYGSICLSRLDDWQSDLTQLLTMTTRVLAVLPANGRRFPPNVAWSEWARDDGCLPTKQKVGESWNAMGTKDESDQKGGEALVAHTNTAAPEELTVHMIVAK